MRRAAARILPGLGLALLLAGAAAGARAPAAPVPDDGRAAFARPAAIPFPADAPWSAEAARLGKRLFFDPRLSGDGDRSCASCHDPATGFQDGLPRGLAKDGGDLPRRTPFLADLAFEETFFWDGRARSLEEQALGPITAPAEMDARIEDVVARLAGDGEYRALFASAFPMRPVVDAANLGRALATFERTILSGPGRFDRWVAGDEQAIGEDAKRGFALFTGKAGCTQCHAGWRMSDAAFYDVGLPLGPAPDRGRGAVLGQPGLDHAFRTPGLRGVANRAPYMHDGSVASLAAIVDHYADGIVRRPGLAPELAEPRPLDAAERADLVAFLETLDGEPAPVAAPGAAPMAGNAPAAEAPPGTRTIIQRDKAFSARRVTLDAGADLVFVNDDLRPHNVRIDDPARPFDGGVQRPGEEVALHFGDPGEYRVICGIHPGMKLDVAVRGHRDAALGH